MYYQKQRSARRGTVAVLVAVCSTVLFSFVAISIDGGVLQTEKRHAQATVDAAAMAAASVLFENYPKNSGTDPDGTAKQAALDYAARNGYTNDGTKSTVTVNIPPLSGAYTGKNGYAEVSVTFNQERSFSRIFGADPVPVKARAVARGAWVAPNVGVLILDYTGKGALTAQGQGAFTETGAPVIVNSNNTSALVDTGNGMLKAPEFRITGGYTTSGNGQLITEPIPNNVLTGVHPTPDPLAYLPVPEMPGLGEITKIPLAGGSWEYTLTPGTYYNLPNFNTGDVVNFQQASAGSDGIYYLASGGLTSTGATLKMDTSTSGGMMIYNAGTVSSDKINITGNAAGTVDLAPLSSGVYKGLTYFQSRAAAQEVHIEGNGSFTIKGTFYAPAAEMQIAGNGTLSNIGSQYISRELALTGNGSIGISWNGDDVARTRIIALVE